MASDRQIAANRKNARKSTGPRTRKGKIVSSRNAITHGLTASKTLLPGESQHDSSNLRAEIFDRLKPDGVLEAQMVERIASLFWRLRRIPVLEAALFEWHKRLQEKINDAEPDDFDKFIEGLPGNGPPPLQLRASAEYDDDGQRDRLQIGRLLESALSNDNISKFGRYERDLSRELRHALEEIRRLQSTRPE